MSARWGGLLLVVALAACNPRPEHALQATPSPVPSADATLLPIRIIGKGTAKRQVVIVEQQGNRKLYELHAKSYTSNSTQTVAEARFSQTQVTFYDKSGSTLVARAPTTTVDERRREVVMTGGVHATSSTGMTLTCDQLTYNSHTGMLHGEGNVHMTKTDHGVSNSAFGNSFDSDVKLTKMQMH
ncbi:MAG TPA: LPS export ABC transporter periplasmic protein LptC [Candidatus Baltobacteraceae bacterium]